MQIIVDGYENVACSPNAKDLEVPKLQQKQEDVNSESECVFFGDFSNLDYDHFFSIKNNAIQNSVQFLCDSYNATKTWVEEGQKHLLNLEVVEPDELLSFHEPESDESASESDLSSYVDNSPQLRNGGHVSNGIVVEKAVQDPIEWENIGQDFSKLDLLNYDVRNDVKFTNGPIDDAEMENGDMGSVSDGAEDEKRMTPKYSDEPAGRDGTEIKHEKIMEKAKTEDHSDKKSWASLFKSRDAEIDDAAHGFVAAQPVIIESATTHVEVLTKESNEEKGLLLISMDTDGRATKLAEFVSHWYPDYSRSHIQLHGLINRANWCYINASLQALIAIPAIYHFFKNLKEFLNERAKETSTPLTDSMISFFDRFEPIEIHSTGKRDNEELNYGGAFEPKGVYEVLSVMKSSLSEKGRQEDAEEFLSFLLNGVHDELVGLSKLVQPKAKGSELTNGDVHESESDEDSWEEVGPKNKVRTTRKAVIEGSLIKHMFGGVICSSVLQTGAKESSTFQPFFTLQLDIQSENIQTLHDAIEFYFMKEKLQGFTCSKTKTEVEASRRVSLEELPLMFIFHLKYFVFDRKGGSQKLHKEIEIPIDLEIPRDILSNSKVVSLSNLRRYKLHAIVYHHGRHAAGGHYTAAVHHGNPFGWVHFDDNQIKTINMNENKHLDGSVPYLLFYERIQPR